MIHRLYHRLRQFQQQRHWSGNIKTLSEFYFPRPGKRQLSIQYRGQRYPIEVRGQSLDLKIMWEIFNEQSEYRLPVEIEPKVIFDVGANIGAATLYFAATYPNARVFSFEPLPQNIELLKQNTAIFADRVTILEKGLGDQPGTFTYHPSDDPNNFGGGTFHGVGCDHSHSIELPVTTVAEVCKQFHINRIDVIKIDAEGAELSILNGTPTPILEQIKTIIGELHSVDDWILWQKLAITHHVGMHKQFDRACYPFVAVRKAIKEANALRLAA